jgi:hypothetical protein
LCKRTLRELVVVPSENGSGRISIELDSLI